MTAREQRIAEHNTAEQVGFTVIELLIAVVVMSVLVTVGVPSFNEFIERQTLRADASVLQTILTTARIEAMTTGFGATTVCWNDNQSARTVSVPNNSLPNNNLSNNTVPNNTVPNNRGSDEGGDLDSRTSSIVIPGGGIIVAEGGVNIDGGFGRTLSSQPLLRDGVSIDNDDDDCIGFDAQGLLTGFAFGGSSTSMMQITLCRRADKPGDAIQLRVNRVGRVSVISTSSNGSARSQSVRLSCA